MMDEDKYYEISMDNIQECFFYPAIETTDLQKVLNTCEYLKIQYQCFGVQKCELSIKVCEDENSIFMKLVEAQNIVCADGVLDLSTYFIKSTNFKLALQLLLNQTTGKFVLTKDLNTPIEYIRMLAFNNYKEEALEKRVINYNNEQIIYDLNYEHVVCIEDGEARIDELEEEAFRRSASYKEQVYPDLSVKPSRLLKLVKKHFNLSNESDIKLFAIYLCNLFTGLIYPQPVMVLSGEKGSSKSTTLRKVERIADPKRNDVSAMNDNVRDLQLKLYSEYFVGLDNLNEIKRNFSDTLAIASTGGSINRKQLYFDINQIILDITAHVALNSVSQIVTQSDLLDRSLIFFLSRIDSSKMCTEQELWAEFDNDLPLFLGAIFNTLAKAIYLDISIKENTKFIRLADFHLMAIKIGHVLGMSQDEVDALLQANQAKVDRETLNSDSVAYCMIELMKNQETIECSMADLHKELLYIARQNGIDKSLMPSAPNKLRPRLSKVKSNLEQQAGITYSIKETRSCKKITVEREI